MSARQAAETAPEAVSDVQREPGRLPLGGRQVADGRLPRLQRHGSRLTLRTADDLDWIVAACRALGMASS